MKRKSYLSILLCAAMIIGFTENLSAGDANAPPVWPRTFEKQGNVVVLYQPQVDEWKDYSKIAFRAAIAVTPKDSNKTDYGVLAVQADTLVDHDARMVLMTNLKTDLRFAGLSEAKEAELKNVARLCLPQKEYLNVSLDHVSAYMKTDVKASAVNLNLNTPPIFYSDSPAILVNYVGQPKFKPIAGTKLMFAINTNWVVLMDMNTSKYYLLNEKSWLTTSDPLKGPWTAAGNLPADFSKLAEDPNWAQVSQNIPGQPATNIPAVFASAKPAELIVTNGPAEYSPISGVHLMYVSNPVMPVFMNPVDSKYYYLVAGRWFSAASLTEPWSAASDSLPSQFAKIPADCPVGYVLASVPGTQQAEDAVTLASIPHKATVNKDAKVDVVYDGTPKFVAIEGTSMKYAVNTSYQVVLAGGQYYCCYDGVWFVAPSATGPWSVCVTVPAVIYTIPPSCPLYNTTYVHVYSSTPGTVVVGYTEGYSGTYVATTGVLMFGAGMLTGALLASDNDYYCWSPSYYSYGCAAHYSYAYGGYYRAGGAYYGPNGGAGWGSSYNPATGTWQRAGYAYGPGGARWGAQAYNPFTNTFAQHTGGTNGYQSWGKTAVSQDGKWAQAGHVSGAAGSAGYVQTSSGKEAAGVHTAGGGTAIKTGGGDVYAGRDGNVYKKSDGQWQKYQGNGNWGNTPFNRPSSTQSQRMSAGEGAHNEFQSSSQDRWIQQESQARLNQDSWARDRGNYNASSSFEARRGSFQGGGFGGGRGGGGFRR